MSLGDIGDEVARGGLEHVRGRRCFILLGGWLGNGPLSRTGRGLG
jgi:hypothetical protein